MRNIFFLLATLVFVTCHDPSPSTTLSGNTLETTSWKLVALNPATDSLASLTQRPTMRLDSGKVKGFGGCNTYFGSYSIQNNSIHFSGIVSTKMFCMHASAVESSLFKVFGVADHFRIKNNQLELFKETDLLAAFEAAGN